MKDRPPSEMFRRLGDQPGVFWGAVAACVAMGVGAVGTWATALGFISIAGTSGEDGQVVLGAAVVGLLALWVRARRDAVWPALVALLCGAVGGGISGVDLHKLSGIGTSDFFGQQVHLVHAGWGIYLAVGAGAALILLARSHHHRARGHPVRAAARNLHRRGSREISIPAVPLPDSGSSCRTAGHSALTVSASASTALSSVDA
jgi:hypothetical protein